MRRVIAQRLTEAKREIPHYYLTVDCRVDALLELRAKINDVMPDTGKVSVNDFIIKAVALTLKKVPALNASWTENAIRRYKTCDVCVAVATQGGLITPIVRNADQKSVGVLSSEIKDLAERARLGKLQPQEYQGGGFTVSNLGTYGVREFAAIINPPQAGILAVGAAEPRPVVTEGVLGIANVMTCTLSADHRVADGSVGAEFLAAFREFIEKPHAILA
jgi:pyruvate dehydrogenase E2 component (dihydrolipoamide acetyltransferase)